MRVISLFLIFFVSTILAKVPSLPTNYLKVPLISQATNFSCGAASLHSILLYWNVYDGNETNLYQKLKTTQKDGTHPKMIVKVARDFGLSAYLKEWMTIEELKTHVDAGNTVIIDIQAWPNLIKGNIPWDQMWEDGHYVVVVGIDGTNVYLMDPSARIGYGYIPLNELISRWHDYEENEKKIWKNHQLGIVISGKKHINAGTLIRVK